MNWTTKTGQKIKIKNMTDSHLTNTIRMLKRQNTYVFDLEPEDFEDFEMDFATLVCLMPHPKYDRLVKEAKKRKILK